MENIRLPRQVFSTCVGLACMTLVASVHALEPTKASELVTLISDAKTPICPNTSSPHTFGDRLMPDGTRVPFRFSNDLVLVITSFDWVVEGSSQANNTVWTAVELMGAGKELAVFSGAHADSIGRAAGYTVVPNGFAVKSGTVLCMDTVGGATDVFARVHGFLAPNR